MIHDLSTITLHLVLIEELFGDGVEPSNGIEGDTPVSSGQNHIGVLGGGDSSGLQHGWITFITPEIVDAEGRHITGTCE